MIDTTGLAMIIVGSFAIIISKGFSAIIINFQNSFWGFKFGKEERRYTRLLIIVGGCLVIVMGFLVSFRVIG